jgi:hypothetical protein
MKLFFFVFRGRKKRSVEMPKSDVITALKQQQLSYDDGNIRTANNYWEPSALLDDVIRRWRWMANNRR